MNHAELIVIGLEEIYVRRNDERVLPRADITVFLRVLVIDIPAGDFGLTAPAPIPYWLPARSSVRGYECPNVTVEAENVKEGKASTGLFASGNVEMYIQCWQNQPVKRAAPGCAEGTDVSGRLGGSKGGEKAENNGEGE